jgi:MHS family proline/betaine transporter-like MFS transporter
MTINDIKNQPEPGLNASSMNSADAGTATRSGGVGTSKMQKRVLAGGSIGQFIEFYDFTLYGLTAVVF